jgi:hypothetical protein
MKNKHGPPGDGGYMNLGMMFDVTGAGAGRNNLRGGTRSRASPAYGVMLVLDSGPADALTDLGLAA